MACNLAILGVTARWLGPEGRGDIAAITAGLVVFYGCVSQSWSSCSTI